MTFLDLFLKPISNPILKSISIYYLISDPFSVPLGHCWVTFGGPGESFGCFWALSSGLVGSFGGCGGLEGPRGSPGGGLGPPEGRLSGLPGGPGEAVGAPWEPKGSDEGAKRVFENY